MRYIDADKIDLKIPFEYASGEIFVDINDVRKAIAMTPTEDVAPRIRTVKEFAERLKKELFKITVIRDIHDEEETDLDSNEVCSKIDELMKEFST